MFLRTPQVKFERVESKGISSVCHGFASLNTNLFRFALDREHMGSPPARIANWGEHLQHRVFVQAPLLHHGFFFSLPISSKYIYEDSLSFIFVIAFSVVMIETKFRNLKGNSGAMENHVYTKDFFLSYLFLLPLNNKEDCYS